MKYIWIVSYSLVWLYVLFDAVRSLAGSVKRDYDIEYWFDDMSYFSYAWLMVNGIGATVASFIMWLKG